MVAAPPHLRDLLAGAVGAALLLAPPPAEANCCLFEDPLVAVSDVAARDGALRLSIDGERSGSSAAMDEMPGVVHEVDQAALRIVGIYSPMERLNVLLVAPFVRREWRAVEDGTAQASGTLSGVGDLDLGIRFALWRRVGLIPSAVDGVVTRAQVLAVSAGTSLPTGSSDATWNGERLDEMFQVGSGGWGPYLGLTWRWREADWDLVLSGTGRLRSANAAGFRYGSGLYAGAELQYLGFDRLTLGLALDGRAAARDTMEGAELPSSGGLLLVAAPSVSLGLGGGLSVRARAQLPVASRLGGSQRVDPSWILGVLYAGR